MSETTSRRGFRMTLVGCAAVAAIIGLKAPYLSSDAAAGRPPGWPAEDLFIIDMARPPALTPAHKDALLLSLKNIAAAPKPGPAVTVDYPFAGSLFPPDMVAPTALFHDADGSSKVWLVTLEVTGEPGRIYVLTDGRRPEPEVDPRCGSLESVYQEPEYQKTAKSWTPDAEAWARLRKLAEKSVTVSINGLREFPGSVPPGGIRALSSGRVVFKISKDPVGAPVFYRDVPLLPTRNEKGVIMPLAEGSLPLIEWRLRDLSKPSGEVVLKNMPTCANCHSFSNDGKYLGMDMDGPSGDKGSYAVAPVRPEMVIQNEQVFTWNSFNPGWVTFGLFSRVSPDGHYVISSVNESVFVTNYLDFRFLQTFYPTRGILAFYDRTTGKIQPLPGAGDPQYVHCNSVWTPDGKSLVFLRAKARDSVPVGSRPEKANDPNEIQIRYDLCTIPFNEGRGGEVRPLPGASGNGKSNSFPKISPDGRWIVWVQAGNGLLMRPDSELYIMPLAGGTPRRMNCNLSPMNSWHSFSPNGRWLVFSSKGRSLFTQMYLTHIDSDGHDSPAILIENATAANRGVNIPEFVNIPVDGITKMDAPATDFYRIFDLAGELARKGDYAAALVEWRKAVELDPQDGKARYHLAFALDQQGQLNEAVAQYQKAVEFDPNNAAAYSSLAIALTRTGKLADGIESYKKSLEIDPKNPIAEGNLAAALIEAGRTDEALGHINKALELDPEFADAHNLLGLVLARAGQLDDGVAHLEKAVALNPDSLEFRFNLGRVLAARHSFAQAIPQFERAVELSGGQEPQSLEMLAAMYSEVGRFPDAARVARRALDLATRENDNSLAETLRARIAYYESQAAKP